MKRCPKCRRDYQDDSLLYCLDDGAALLEGPSSTDEEPTAMLSTSGAKASGASELPGQLQKETNLEPVDPGFADSSASKLSDQPTLVKETGPALYTSQADTASRGSFSRGSFALGAALLFILAATGFGIWYFGFRGAQAAIRNTRFPIVIPDGAVPYADVETHSLSISPDGSDIAFIASSKGVRAVWIRPLDSLDAHSLPGTEN